MIADLFVGAMTVFVTWLWGLIGAAVPEPPGSLQTTAGYVGALWRYVESFGQWLPLPVILACLGATVACLFAAITIQIIRTIVSYATFGGGST